jgi:hypothetical protein
MNTLRKVRFRTVCALRENLTPPADACSESQTIHCVSVADPIQISPAGIAANLLLPRDIQNGDIEPF